MTRQCTRVHRLGVQKTCKIGGKGCVFGHIDKFGKDMADKFKKKKKKKKTPAKTRIYRVYFQYLKINGCDFGHIDKFWKGHGRQIRKSACKNTYL